MANLKEIRNRITSIGSTMKITSAMKMVSAAKLKKAQDAITAMRPYADKLTEATIEKLTPLTTLVRDSVEGVGEARLSLQEQTDVIRNAMNLLAGELSDLLAENRIGIDQKSQIRSLIELKTSIDELNKNLKRDNKGFNLKRFFNQFKIR